MSHSIVPSASRAARILFAGLAASLLAGCSADSLRLGDAFTNPFGTAGVDKTPTSSIAKSAGTKIAAAHPSPIARPGAVTSAPLSTESITKSVSQPNLASAAGWSAEGGTPIVAAQGESADMLSTRYGVPVAALLKVNGFNTASQVQPGTRLIVPVYNAASSGASPLPVKTADKTPAAAKPAAAKTAKPAAAPSAQKPAQVQMIQTFSAKKPSVIPGAVAAPSVAKLAPAKAQAVAKAETVKPETAKASVATAAPAVDPTPTASLQPAEERAAPAAGANPEFRWPARGRIIQGFKAGAGGNDGINIAVPEGTSVKAAEGGVVAYAGSELKGYGNLVLIRHPNGFVSAYANNGEISVKRGDQVKRGQIVAKSGQSGNVSSPQLHFELRKGSVPVDPTNFLAGL